MNGRFSINTTLNPTFRPPKGDGFQKEQGGQRGKHSPLPAAQWVAIEHCWLSLNALLEIGPYAT